MDRLNQLREEAGSSQDSLNTSAAPSEAYITANESSKYFSLGEDDSSFDTSSIKDVPLDSTADSDKTITEPDQLIPNLSPIAKNDLLDSYKIGKQIEAANILSGGVDIFDDNDNSYDGDELVIDDNAIEFEDTADPTIKLAENEESPLQQAEEIVEPEGIVEPEEILEPQENVEPVVIIEPEGIVEPEELPEPQEPVVVDNEPALESRDTEVVLQIDGRNVNAIDIGNGLYLYRKVGEEELAAVQIIDDDHQQPSFKFLKVRENAEGNLEVYEEIEIEVPEEVPARQENPEECAPSVPVIDKNKAINDSNKEAERNLAPQMDAIPSTSKSNTGVDSKEPQTDKCEVNPNGKMMKFNETRKSPVIHSTPNKEGIPLTKTMVDQQLHPNRHLDKVKTIELHTDNSKQKSIDQPKFKDSDENNHIGKEKDISSEKLNEVKQKIESSDKIETVPDNKVLGNKKKEMETVPDSKVENKEEETKSEIDLNKPKDLIIKENEIKCIKSGNKDIAKYAQNKTDEVIKDDQASTSKLAESTTNAQKDEEDSNYDKLTIVENLSDESSTQKTDYKETKNVESQISLDQLNQQTKNLKPHVPKPKEKQETEEGLIVNKKQVQPLNRFETTGSPNEEKQPTGNLKLNTTKESQEKEAQNAKNIESNTALKLTEGENNHSKNSGNKEVNDVKNEAAISVMAGDTKTIDKASKTISTDVTKQTAQLIQITKGETNVEVSAVKLPKETGETEQIQTTDDQTVLEQTVPIENKKLEFNDTKDKIISEKKDLDSNKKGNQQTAQFTNDLQKGVFNAHRANNITKAKSQNNSNINIQNVNKNQTITTLEHDYLKINEDIVQITKSDKLTDSTKPETRKKSESLFTNIDNLKDIKPLNDTKHLQVQVLKEQKKSTELDMNQKSTKELSVPKEFCEPAGNVKKNNLLTRTDQMNKKIEVKSDKFSMQTLTQNRPEIKKEVVIPHINTGQKPLNNNHAAVPFGKWTEANRQEFLNKIRESKVPIATSNTKQIKQPNDLNRRDVLQKIDSQRQHNTTIAKAQETSKLNIKTEIKSFASKPLSRDNKATTKAEVVTSQNKTISKKPCKLEVQKIETKLPNTSVAIIEQPKKETSQRNEFNNQDLIDRTIEGIINRAVTTKPPPDNKTNAQRQPFNMHKEIQKEIDVQERDNQVKQAVGLDDIETKMNELHGIPFVERPPHELPKVLNTEGIKTYSKTDNQKLVLMKQSKIPSLLPFTKGQQKVVKDNVIEIDSEEEIIEHEPVTGDIDKKNRDIQKLTNKHSSQELATQSNLDPSKKEAIITEKDFDKFARRNSITYENCLKVNFESQDQPNVIQTVVERDVPEKKYSRNELLLAEAKMKSTQKHKSAPTNIHASKIHLSSNKGIPVTNDGLNKTYPSKLQLAYHTALTTKHQTVSPITIIEDKPVKVVYLDSTTEFVPGQLNVQGRELSPSKKPTPDIDAATVSTCDSLDFDLLDSVEALEGKTIDETKIKSKHQRKQVLTPVEAPEMELIEPVDLGIEMSPKKKRKVDDNKTDKNAKTLVPKKTYLLGRNIENNTPPQHLVQSPVKETIIQSNAVISHKNTASAIDNLVKAAELLETQSEKMNSSNTSTTENSQQITPIKRGRGRPRKYPLPEGTQTQDKSKVPSPQKKPRLIDGKRPRRHSSTEEEDDDSSDEGIVKENWTMGKINENIVCPICNKLFRSENVVFKHVKHCTGPSPNRSSSDKRSPRRRSRHSKESESRSRESRYDDMDYEDYEKNTPKTRKSSSMNNTDKDVIVIEDTPMRESKDSTSTKNTITEDVKHAPTPKSNDSTSRNNTDKEDVIVIEDTPAKEKLDKLDQPKQLKSKRVSRLPAQNHTSLTCEFCGKSFRQLSYLINHKLQHKKDEPKEETNLRSSNKSVFSCEVCKKEFRKLHHLVQHRLMHNPNVAPRPSRKSSFEQNNTKISKNPESSKQAEDQNAAFRCEPCDKSFRKLHHLVEHRETHDGINRQKCTVVSQPTADKPEAVPPPPQCDICKKTFRKLHHLIEHKEQHHETIAEKSDDRNVKSSLSTKDIIHECSLCYMVFPNESALNKHTVICQRKKRQSAIKQAKPTEEQESEEQTKVEEPHTEEMKQDDVEEIEPILTLENKVDTEKEKEEEDKLEANGECDTELPLKVTENSQSKEIDNKVLESKSVPTKKDIEVSEKSTINIKTVPEIPAFKKKITKEKILKKNVKDKSAKVTKRLRTSNVTLPKEEKPVVESSDDDEVRYMLNPDFKLEDEEETFMKVRAKKRSSLQIERPNSKDRELNIVKRRTSYQHPIKVPRLKPKPVETKRVLNTTPLKSVAKVKKAEPVPLSDSDDSEVKYSFPKTIINKAPAVDTKREVQNIPKQKRKSMAEKRKTLVGVAKRKSVGRPPGSTKKVPSVTPIKKRPGAELRCDCGQAFGSAALLARHVSLAHTPPRRRRRSPPPDAPANNKNQRNNASATDKNQSNNASATDKNQSNNATATDKKLKRSATRGRPPAAHSGVPLPDKMRRLTSKLK